MPDRRTGAMVVQESGYGRLPLATTCCRPLYPKPCFIAASRFRAREAYGASVRGLLVLLELRRAPRG
jgi:hypothetical protein